MAIAKPLASARTLLLATLVGISAMLFAAPHTKASAQNRKMRAVDYVNPMIGTDGHGHTYPGATVPFGMVQLSPDAGHFGWDECSGYHYSDRSLVGFSHTHLSGTGCADLADILFTPTVGLPNPDSLTRFRIDVQDQIAVPGYYRVLLKPHAVEVELTATARAGFHRYWFHQPDSACVVVDLGYGNDDTPMETFLTIENPTEISGHRNSSGWAKNQHVYFAARFSKPFHRALAVKEGEVLDDAASVSGKMTKGIFFMSVGATEPILVKVGISAVSVEGARRNLSTEIPDWDFDHVRAAARDAWQQELSVFDVESGSRADLETFYTALYHTMLAPTLFCDVDGQYRGGDGQIHRANGFENYCTFSLWDTYRAAHPLYTMFQPKRVPDLINSMLAFYRESGLLPVWSLAGNETWCMIGYHSVPVIADAYMKGFSGFDPHEALTAMKKSALQNRRGLEYYNLVTPQPLQQKLAELKTEQMVSSVTSDTFLTGDCVVLKGWTRSISGETIRYHSSYPYVTQALLSRATTGSMAVVWETEPLPALAKSGSVLFMWVAGLATGKGGHRFDLIVDGQPWLSFHSARDTSQQQWEVIAENGVSLTFVPTRRDRFDDLFGNMYLRVPPDLQTVGVPFTLEVVGEQGGSPDWYMTFEHAVEEAVRVEPVYALAEDGGRQYQFLRLLIEHPAPGIPATVALNGGAVLDMDLCTGLTLCDIPIVAVPSPVTMTVSVEMKSKRVERVVTVLPVVPYGYIPADKEHESVSNTLEYAYDDWCIAQIARALGEEEDFQLFSRRALHFRNLYDSTTGFMRGRNSDGSWVTPFDPRFGTAKQPQYTEGNAWQYTWYVPHDVPGLISLMGGKSRFIRRLDSLFHQSSDLEGAGAPPDMTGLIGLYAHGNEPSHHIAYLYNYAGAPWKTQEVVHRICSDFYSNRPDGLCGNEDCGQMSAWYIFSALGFYPVNPADGTYQIGTPLFPHVSLDVGYGKPFVVTAENLSHQNFYVQSASLNGEALKRTFITHREIMNGGTLAFVMGPQPNFHWGTESESGR